MITIPNAKELKGSGDFEVLNDWIAKAILEADKDGQKSCSVSMEDLLPGKLRIELQEKGYEIKESGVTNFVTLKLYW